uniref:Uncharacterized protein n=1 Tax=Candidatus Kentrum eta TaxID=2126337 RepID=A0A450UE44_9GAMM|nr:MAG: hypothetical protein BECKH772A_GA0070896_100246 [Candidatus Kentron sp. H]VFJ98520.1 MAG: hypothetical protein BECKH772C_GA0070978_100225 [Candidatus Kentron sp. H]
MEVSTLSLAKLRLRDSSMRVDHLSESDRNATVSVEDSSMVTAYLPRVREGEAPAEPYSPDISGSAGASPSRISQ